MPLTPAKNNASLTGQRFRRWITGKGVRPLHDDRCFGTGFDQVETSLSP
jgi:hypothetical protein